MEIKNNELIFHLEEKEINGITGNQLNEVEDLIMFNSKDIEVNRKKVEGKDKYRIQKEIEVIDEYIEIDNYYKNIYDWLWNQIKKKELYPKDIVKKIKDAVKIVGLDEEILERGLLECSSSEKKLLQISSALLSNPEIIILKEPFKTLDINNKKRLKLLLSKFVEKYHKLIIIISNNANYLYEVTNHLIIIKKNKLIIEGSTSKVYEEVSLLKKNKINIPDIVEITYLARTSKNIKIDYHKDVRDIIKDIYKHV